MIKNPAAFPIGLALLILCTSPAVACSLKISDAWIREAPPGLMTLAGYAVLTNDGNQPISIVKTHSDAFAEVQMHETKLDQGVASMHAIDKITINSHQRVEFAPGGKHLMLMGATGALKVGDVVRVTFHDQQGCVTAAEFKVRRNH